MSDKDKAKEQEKKENATFNFPPLTKEETIDGYMSVSAGVFVHLFAGSFYVWGIMKVYIDSYFRLVENPKLDSNLMNVVFPLISTLTGIFMNVGLWQLKKIGAKLTLFTQGFIIGGGVFLSSYTTEFWQFFFLFGCTFGVIRGTCYIIAHQVSYKYFEGKKGLISGIILFSSGVATFPPSFLFQYVINPQNISPVRDQYGGYNFPREITLRFPIALRLQGIYYFILFCIGSLLIRERKLTHRINKLENYEKHIRSQHSHRIASILKEDQDYSKKEIEEEMEKILAKNEGKSNYMQLEDEIDIEEPKDNSPLGDKQRSRYLSDATQELKAKKQLSQVAAKSKYAPLQPIEDDESYDKKRKSSDDQKENEKKLKRFASQSQQVGEHPRIKKLSIQQKQDLEVRIKQNSALSRLSIAFEADKPQTVWDGFFSKQCFILGSIIYFSGAWGYYIFSNFKTFGQTLISDDKFLSIAGAIACIPNGVCQIFWGYLYDRYGYKFTYLILVGLQILTTQGLYYLAMNNKYAYMLGVTMGFVTHGAVICLTPPICVRTFGMQFGLEIYALMYVPSWGFSNFSQYFIALYLQPRIGFYGLFSIFTLFCLGTLTALYFFDPDYQSKPEFQKKLLLKKQLQQQLKK